MKNWLSSWGDSMIEFFPAVEAVPGFRAAGVHAGLKPDGALDFALIESRADCVTAGVFTANRVKAAPVLFNRARLHENPQSIRAVAVNTVSANACTGAQGLENARKTADETAKRLGVSGGQVLVMSTGVIGTHLPMPKILRGIELASAGLGQDWSAAAAAMMTTDTRPKLASVRVQSARGAYTIAGVVKGAGMIAPDMATMLSVLVTDAKLTLPQAQETLRAAARQSYNRIVVDGDTSTNDMVVLLANGISGQAVDTAADREVFQGALNRLTRFLAQEVVRDGEGASKFITLDIRNAESAGAAEKIGRTIGASMLTKAAFYGSDANWGRIVAAAGRADVPFDPDRASLWIAPGEAIADDELGLRIFSGGGPTDYQEARAADIMAAASIYITLDCGLGQAGAVIWTCDLSHEYVSINGDYRS